MASTPAKAVIGEPDEMAIRRLDCGKCRADLGRIRAHRQGGRVLPMTELVPGLVKLHSLPESGLQRFGIGQGVRLHPERLLVRPPIKSPASLLPSFPRPAVGRGARPRTPEPKPGLRTFEARFGVYCPACSRDNLVDLTTVDLTLVALDPARSATMDVERPGITDRQPKNPDRAKL